MSAPARRESYEGNLGGWQDGRLGQAYDLVWEALRAHDLKAWRHPLLNAIEALDAEFQEGAA